MYRVVIINMYVYECNNIGFVLELSLLWLQLPIQLATWS